MGDLLARLQRAVGDAYRVENELGGGGMSRLFLATEASLHRQVVIKLLPPEYASEVSAARFQQEIEFAAHLQHPNILPVLTAAAKDDLLFYVMPFVSGESLRHRLTRDGKLPVADVVRILHEIADALAYAHAEGVLHRDVKPENILLRGSHALLMDFGVARALTEVRSGGRLTDTGVAVGTPAYMSPEQAAGERHVDARADVYALAVVGYEMLAGLPPFAGPTPRALIAAQLTATAKPLTDVRPETPPNVSKAITQALAKDPNARLRTAVEFRDAISPPTARTQAPIALTHPIGMAALYVAGSLLVLGAVHVLRLWLGLPDWVFAGAAVLLGVGLPVMLVTAALERRRAVVTATGSAALAPQGMRRWFTWRRSLLGGAAAFSGLGIATAAYMAMRLLGIGPAGTLVASGVLKQRERVLLAEFQNRSRDSTLGASLSEAFRIDLSQSPTVKVVDAQTVTEELQRMRRAPETRLDLGLSREIAIRLGIKAVLSGEIDPVGRGYLLSASVVSAGDGQVLTGVREAAENDAALIRAIDRLSKRLRERIGESLRTIRADPPLERVTTGSLDALRKYSAGVRVYDEQFDLERTIRLLEEAVAIDTGFGMAYAMLADVLAHAGVTYVRVVGAATQAFEHRDRMPAVERYLTIAQYYEVVNRDLTRQMDAYGSVLQLDPDNFRATEKLAFGFLHLRRWAEAESLYARAARLRSGWEGPLGAIWAQVAQGHVADGQATLDRYRQRSPLSPVIPLYQALLETARGDYATAEQEFDRLRVQAERLGDRSTVREHTMTLAMLAELRGKLAQAAQYQREFMAESEEVGLFGTYISGGRWAGWGSLSHGGALGLAWLDLQYRNRASAALTAVDAALKRHPLSTIPPVDRPYTALAAFFAHAGRLSQAKQLLAEFETEVPEIVRKEDFFRFQAAAEVALAEGRLRDAMAAYRRLYDEAGCAMCGLFEIATIDDRAGERDSALVTYEQVAVTPALWGLYERYSTLAPTYRRLGELYEERGDRAKARDAYTRFVELWKDADPELQPIVADARAALKRLTAGPP